MYADKLLRTTRLLAIWAVCLVMRGGFLRAQQPAAKVSVSVSQAANGVMYTYTVQNNSGFPVVGLAIGWNSASDFSQLTVLPAAWTYGGGLPAQSQVSPKGWVARVVTEEGSPRFYVGWSADGGPQYSIAAGRTGGPFGIILKQATDTYRNASFDVLLGNSTHITGQLQPATVSLPGDVNGDGRVDCTDIAVVKASFGKKAADPGFDARADLNGDGVVDIRDLAFVSQHLPAGTHCK